MSQTRAQNPTLISYILQHLSPPRFRTWVKMLMAGALTLSLYHTLRYFFFIVKRPRLIYQDNILNRSLIRLCPTLTTKYYPSFFFTNTHLATFACTYLRSRPRMNFKRERLVTEDGGHVHLDWADLQPTGGIEPHDLIEELSQSDEDEVIDEEETRPTIMFFHGLNGGSDAKYIRHAIRVVNEKFGMGKARFLVMNNRGAGGTKLATPKSYCGAYTEDVRTAIAHVHRKAPNSPIIAIGYSLGANILVKYLGEEGDRTPVRAAISVSNPFDFVASTQELAGRPIYNFLLTRGCLNTVSRHLDVFAQHEGIDLKSLFKTRRLCDFDSQFTCIVFGYKDVEEYYNDASSAPYIPRVAVPLLVVHAQDDPIVAKHALSPQHFSSNSRTILMLTEYGGHVAFPEGIFPGGMAAAWVDRVIAEYANAAVLQRNDYSEE